MNSVDEGLQFLAETDDEMAVRKEAMERAHEMKKRTFAVVAQHSDGKTVAQREASAYESDKYQEACGLYFKALRLHEELRNQRTTTVIRIEVWRSKNASARQGNVT